MIHIIGLYFAPIMTGYVTGELDADLYSRYYGPTDEVTRDDLAQEVKPAADLEV
ncbi:hypothetical protein M6B38_401840 [Iris pallida]|uniref:Uncharacterized protein n=1 Tax=Iris pallida TaxID=29817 RepID=A0AAX6FU28_IRIPA|nr:hypothetical protein M6B38_401840 [Iris pallida]